MKYITRPSSLPAQSISPRWVSSGSNENTEAGKARHKALEALLSGNDNLVNALHSFDADGVRWAYSYILRTAPMGDYPIQSEQKIDIYRDGKVILDGTADVLCGDHIFDLKWMEHDYRAQMAAYALGLMQRRNTLSATVHILYGATRTVKSYHILKSEAENLVYSTYDKVADPNTPCVASSYCGWCANNLTCSVLNEHVNKVAVGLEMVPVEDLTVVSPAQVAAALNLAKQVEVWCEAVKTKAREMAESGMDIPGYKLSHRAGQREIEPDKIKEAFQMSGLPAETFLKCCKISLQKLNEVYSSYFNLRQSEARTQLNDKLAGIVTNKPTQSFLTKKH